MSKLSFRAKALDPSKPMPVYVGNEVPDLLDFAVVNRTVPEMPTGMEKEEETVSWCHPWHVDLTTSRHLVFYNFEKCSNLLPFMHFL